jgi:hypothetical protein
MIERMSDRGINLVDEPSSTGNVTVPPAAHAPLGPEEHLPTNRLPALAPPPPRPSSRAASQPSQQSMPAMPSLPAEPKTSWWKALLSSTFRPPAPGAAAGAELPLDHRIAIACAAGGARWLLGAGGGGRGGAPSRPPAPVAAAMVASRGLFGLGLLGVSYALLRMAERFFQRGRAYHDARGDERRPR